MASDDDQTRDDGAGREGPRLVDFGEDYRGFARALIAHRQATLGGSHRYPQYRVAERAGMTPAMLSRCLRAPVARDPGTRLTRRLTPDAARRLAEALELRAADADLFVDLVILDHLEEGPERLALRHRLAQDRLGRENDRALELLFRYISHWHQVAIRELVALPGFRPDADWIADRLVFPVARADIEAALRDLPRLGVCTVDEDGTWRVGPEPVITLGHEAGSLAAGNFHRQILELVATSIAAVPRARRMLNTKTIRIARARLPALRLRLIELINGFVDGTDDEGPADCVYQVHASLIPLATVGDDRGVEGA
ncbi:MAG: TIGR02147 family protein [Myxococcales bacterium]|nr:TIGR02147 family protein [Myxococcales bacterium]